MQLTVGIIEEQLRRFPKETLVNINCGCCNHSASGDETILSIKDYTVQTHGYVEMEFNSSSQSDIKLNPNEKEFYENEVKRLKEKISSLNYIIEEYENSIGYIKEDVNRLERILNRKEKIKL